MILCIRQEADIRQAQRLREMTGSREGKPLTAHGGQKPVGYCLRPAFSWVFAAGGVGGKRRQWGDEASCGKVQGGLARV